MEIENLVLNQIYSNKEIMDIFKCDNNRGIRVSLKTNSIVLINKFRSRKETNPYQDTPMNNNGELLYTGEGKVGDQKISGGNKRVVQSHTNGMRLFYFESYKSNEYTFKGEVVYLNHEFAEEKDLKDNKRKVVKFSLRLRNESDLIFISDEAFEKQLEKVEKELASKSKKELAKMLNKQRVIRINNVLSKQYYKDPVVKAYTLRRANGRCDLCGKYAPFTTKKGEPYLESHHVKYLENDGLDSISNTVALCPNCHKKLHYGKKERSDYIKKINIYVR